MITSVEQLVNRSEELVAQLKEQNKKVTVKEYYKLLGENLSPSIFREFKDLPQLNLVLKYKYSKDLYLKIYELLSVHEDDFMEEDKTCSSVCIPLDVVSKYLAYIIIVAQAEPHKPIDEALNPVMTSYAVFLANHDEIGGVMQDNLLRWFSDGTLDKEEVSKCYNRFMGNEK